VIARSTGVVPRDELLYNDGSLQRPMGAIHTSSDA
jgi:hypothetical protein